MPETAGANWTVSVIIPTRNRPHDLTVTLQTLVTQTVLPRQVVIIDQSDCLDSQRAVHDVFSGVSKTVRETIQVVYERDTSISGGAVARNRAMEMSSGDIWLFLDDDVELDRDFIEQILAAYRHHPDAVGVSGVVTNYPPPKLAFRLWSRLFCTGPFWDERQPIYWSATHGERRGPQRVRKFGAGLMSFRADAIRHLRFDPNLRGTSDGEDVDFCARLKPDSALYITSTARLIHNHSAIGRSQEHWIARHARTHWYLYRRNWNHGLMNFVAFGWLNVGYILITVVSCLLRFSFGSCRGYWKAVQESRALAS